MLSALLGFGLFWELLLLFLSYFSLLGWECLPYACLTIAFWKHITCLVSQLMRNLMLEQVKTSELLEWN